MADLDGIRILPEPSAGVLNQRQQVVYKATRKKYLSWLIVFGIDPKKGEGYAFETVKPPVTSHGRVLSLRLGHDRGRYDGYYSRPR